MHIFTVEELTQAVKEVLEAQFPFVWVRGQVSNLARPGSGHVYFSLKDGSAVLNVVWFKSNQPPVPVAGKERINPLTGEVEEAGVTAGSLAEGQEVLCAGRLNVYPPRGSYQLIAELVQDQGVGRLHLAFEAMKRKLLAKGYFDSAAKKQVPYGPSRVAVVTSVKGAALQDFLRIAGERGISSEIRVYPSLVQGDRAGREIAAALDAANADGWAEVVVLIRGGGSLEDLWAFNTEEVADAVFRSRLPVLTGIGHEVDTSIADLVADRRVATPSHTAQVLWQERGVLRQQVDELETSLHRAYASRLEHKERELAGLRQGLSWFSPSGRLQRSREQVAELLARMQRGVAVLEGAKGGELAGTLHRLQRAYGPHRADARAGEFERLLAGLERAGEGLLLRRERELESLTSRLSGLDPEAPLERGYCMVRDHASGKLLRSVKEVQPESRIDVRMSDGTLETEVLRVVPEK